MNRLWATLAFSALLLVSPLAAHSKDDRRVEVIPAPSSVEFGKGRFKAAGANFNCDPSIDAKSQKVIAALSGKMAYVTGRPNTFASPAGLNNSSADQKMKGFIFLKDDSMGPEEYTLEATERNCTVKASAFHGFLYSVQTIMQLVDGNLFGTGTDPKSMLWIPCVKISDSPRFAYRGLHLDCARHFFPVEEVKKILDIMAVYKLNRFHWHLTDDQGWRIEIKAFPRLTEVGAIRKGTMVGADFDSNDGIRYGGYYTQEQIREVVGYADALGIEIIPEIDIPGHSSAALAAYPFVSCTEGPFEVLTRWGGTEHTLCPGKEVTFTLLEGIFSEIAELFPSEYVHIGGDECPKTEWKACPDCQARIAALGLKDEGGHSAEDYLQSYLTARVQKYLSGLGKKIIGWDEILEGKLEEGATVMSWRGTAGGQEASSKGFDVIMTPNTYCYFDYLQAQEGEPLGGGDLTLEKVYSYEPFEGLDESQQKHILGVQANVWTEYIPTIEHLEYMLLPRLAAMSEVQWSKSPKDFKKFNSALRNRSFKIYDSLGFNYRNK